MQKLVDGELVDMTDEDHQFVQDMAANLVVPVFPVSATKAKIALHRAGLLDQVKTLVAANPEAQIWYDTEPLWSRSNPYIAEFAAALTPPLTDAQIDALFAVAATIEA